MRIITNEKLIRRNRKIGQYLSIASLLILGVGLYMSFRPELISYSFIALVLGFITSQIGIYYGNRWGRTPRPDEVLNAALKGLDNRFSLYHYTSPVSHLLVGPTGVWVLLPYGQRGTITYAKNRWSQKGGNLYLKIFAQEGLGRPELEAKSATDTMDKFLTELPEGEALKPAQAILVFTHPEVKVEAAEAPVTALSAEKLKEYIRLRLRNKSENLPMDKVTLLERALPGGESDATDEEEEE